VVIEPSWSRLLNFFSGPSLTLWPVKENGLISAEGKANHVRYSEGGEGSLATYGIGRKKVGTTTFKGVLLTWLILPLLSLTWRASHWFTPSHDAAKQVVRSRDLQPSSRVATLDAFHKAIVKTYVVNGYNVVTTATGTIKYPDGSHEDIIL